MFNSKTFYWINSITIAVLFTVVNSNKSQAFFLNWHDDSANNIESNIDWTPLDNTGDHNFVSGQTFTNIDGSGVDVTIMFSNNMWDGSPNVYNQTRALQNSGDVNGGETYDYSLRMTNDIEDPLNPTWFAIQFSQPVTLNEFWVGSISKISSVYEVARLSAYSGTYSTLNPFSGLQELNTNNLNSNDLVEAALYNTYEEFFGGSTGSSTGGDLLFESNQYSADNPDSVSLDPDTSDYVYETVGVGEQLDNKVGEYGRVFFQYDTPVQTIYIEQEGWDSSDRDNHNFSTKLSSIALSPQFEFDTGDVPTPNSGDPVPFEFSPSLGIWLGGGIFGLLYWKKNRGTKNLIAQEYTSS